MMPVGEWAVSGVVVPFLAAFAVAALLHGLAAAGGYRLRTLLASLAVGLGYVAGHMAVALPAVPPRDVTDRIVGLVALGTALAMIATRIQGVPGARGVIRLLLTSAVALALFLPVFSFWSQTNEGVLAMLLAIGVLLGSLGGLEALGQRVSGTVLGGMGVFTASVAGVVLAATGSLTLGRLAIVLAAALCGAWVVDRRAIQSPAAFVFATALGALLIEGWVYSSLPGWAALLLGALPIVAGLAARRRATLARR